MRLDRTHRTTRGIRRPVIGAIAGLMVFGGILAGNVQADPAADALAKLNELSRQAEETTEAMHSAQLDLQEKVAAQQTADAQARRGHGSGRCGRYSVGNVPERRRQDCCRAVHGWPHRRTRRHADRDVAAGPDRSTRRAAGDGHRDVGADAELQDELRAGHSCGGGVRQVRRRREDRRRAGRRSARRPAIQAKQAPGTDRRRQVAVHGADPGPAGGPRGAPACARTRCGAARPCPRCGAAR